VVTDTVAWRQRRLNFDNAGLAEMVAEFNRYNPTVHLRLEGIPQGMYRYSGVFDVADPESFISFLRQEPDLEIVRRGTAVIVRPRAPRGY
jgi:ferric-dicitrate binding protein FerR (iron transport regulator)